MTDLLILKFHVFPWDQRNVCQLFVFLVCCYTIIRRYRAVSQLHSHALKHGRLLSTPNAKISWRILQNWLCPTTNWSVSHRLWSWKNSSLQVSHVSYVQLNMVCASHIHNAWKLCYRYIVAGNWTKPSVIGKILTGGSVGSPGLSLPKMWSHVRMATNVGIFQKVTWWSIDIAE